MRATILAKDRFGTQAALDDALAAEVKEPVWAMERKYLSCWISIVFSYLNYSYYIFYKCFGAT